MTKSALGAVGGGDYVKQNSPPGKYRKASFSFLKYAGGAPL
jgi:hypothetical protein